MLKHEEILCNEAFQNAVYLSVHEENQMSLYALINELQKILKEVGNGPVTFSCVGDQTQLDETDRRLILTISTADKKIHSFYIH